MRNMLTTVAGIVLATTPLLAQPTSPKAMAAQIEGIVREHERLGSKPFSTSWPGGSPKEKLERLPDGTITYSRFFPTGGFAVRYEKKASKAIVYERFFGNGKTSELLRKDERIVDYTSYWENGVKKAKYQYNLMTKATFYDARDEKGAQVYPPVKKR